MRPARYIIRFVIKIQASIGNAPLFIPSPFFLEKLARTGIDGLEIIPGMKARGQIPRLAKLAKQHNIPIFSFHEPVWSGINFYFDERLFRKMATLGILSMTIHPPTRAHYKSKKAASYFEKFAVIQEKYGIQILVENMSRPMRKSVAESVFPMDPAYSDLSIIAEIAKNYNFKITYDVSHARLKNPQENEIFRQIYPLISNIHASSFMGKKEHLPLYLGDFAAKEFFSFLQKENYQGLFTLEIFYPSIYSFARYDFEAIRKSVSLLKENA